MNPNLSLDVIEIEGIGPVLAPRLRQIGVPRVQDLLFVTPARLHGAVRDVCSEAQAERWQRMAALMQADEISPQWAEALVGQGVTSLETVSLRSVDELAQLFEAARQQHVTHDVPGAATLAEMKARATALYWTGTLLGEVTDAQGNPVAGVRAILGRQTATSDARGRFRLAYVGGGSARAPLYLKKPGFRTKKADPAPLLWGDRVIRVARYRLAPAAAGQEAAERYSEFAGDRLPDTGAAGVRVVDVDPARLRDGDVFKITEFYERWPSAKLLSRFRDFEDGELVAYKVKYPRAQMPPDARPGDFLLFYKGKMYSYPAFPPEKHSLLLAVRRFQKENPRLPTSAEEFRERMAALVRFVYQNRKP